MSKRLVLLISVALVAAIILVARFDKNYDSPGYQYNIKCVQQSDPPPAAASLSCAVNPIDGAHDGKSSATWYHKLLAWPEGITAWLLLLTLGAILWQSYATAKSADAALLQIQMMKDKERARVEIKAMRLQLERISEDFWYIKASMELRNVGANRAYIRLGTGNLAITGESLTGPPHDTNLSIVGGFIDANSDPVTEFFHFFQPENTELSEFSQKICDGVLSPSITGFIEYETVGARFHVDFEYVWIGHGSPLNVGAMFGGSDEFSPKTDEDRVSFGYWSSGGVWLTGKSGNNDEFEMEPLKKAARPKNN
jgi:hypothetical protein